jgi:hypothetical protein
VIIRGKLTPDRLACDERGQLSRVIPNFLERLVARHVDFPAQALALFLHFPSCPGQHVIGGLLSVSPRCIHKTVDLLGRAIHLRLQFRSQTLSFLPSPFRIIDSRPDVLLASLQTF